MFFSKSNLFFIGLLIFLTLFTFAGLPQTFYQQDEWLGLGQIWSQGWGHVINGFSPIQILFAEGRPLTRVFGVLLFGNFPFNSLFLSIYSVGFHTINSILIFLIAFKLLKKPYLAFIASLFFSVNSVAHQSVTWFGASFGTQPASFLIFLSIYCFLIFLEERKNIFLNLAFSTALISLYFKETSIFLFFFFPLLEIIYCHNFSFRAYAKKYLPFIIFIILFSIFRLYEMMVITANSSSLLGGKVFANIGDHYILLSLVVRFFMYPLTSFFLIFIPPSLALNISSLMWKIYYPYITLQSNFVYETVILDLLAIIGSFILFIILYVIWKKEKKYNFAIIVSLLLFISSITPYVVVAKSFAYMEPRYYYISSLASGLILAIIVGFFTKIKSKIFKVLLSVVLLTFFLVHMKTIQRDTFSQVDLAKERKGFLTQLSALVPTLTKNKNIFYMDGDRPRFVDNNKSPFQNGLGYTLMVYYYNSKEIPAEFLSEGYLWNLQEEGYRQMHGKGFGYYYDAKIMEEDLVKYHLDHNLVISLYYSSDKKKLYKQ